MFVVKKYEHHTVIMDADRCDFYVVPDWTTGDRTVIQKLADQFNLIGKLSKRAIIMFEAEYRYKRC